MCDADVQGIQLPIEERFSAGQRKGAFVGGLASGMGGEIGAYRRKYFPLHVLRYNTA